MRSRLVIIGIAISGLIIISFIIVAAPFSVAVAVNAEGELRPDQPVLLNLKGLGLKTEVKLVKGGEPIPGKLKKGEFHPAGSLEYDSTYTVSVKTTNWLGQSSSIKRVIKTWTTPKVKKITVLNSLGKLTEGTATIPQAVTSDSTLTILFNRNIDEAKITFDDTSTSNFRLRKNKIVMPLSGMPQGSTHIININKLIDFEGHRMLKGFNISFSIVSEPVSAFSVSEGQIVGRNQAISISFDKPMVKESVVIEASFSQSSSWNNEGAVLTITPTDQNYNSGYTLKVKAGARSIDAGFLTTARLVNYKTGAKLVVKAVAKKADPMSELRKRIEQSKAEFRAKYPNGMPRPTPPPVPMFTVP